MCHLVTLCIYNYGGVKCQQLTLTLHLPAGLEPERKRQFACVNQQGQRNSFPRGDWRTFRSLPTIPRIPPFKQALRMWATDRCRWRHGTCGCSVSDSILFKYNWVFPDSCVKPYSHSLFTQGFPGALFKPTGREQKPTQCQMLGANFIQLSRFANHRNQSEQKHLHCLSLFSVLEQVCQQDNFCSSTWM